MKYVPVLFLIAFVAHFTGAPPVTKNKKDNGSDKENEIEEKEELELEMEYHRYLNEVVQALESDPEFRAKLEKADEADIHTGKIAYELPFVNHKVRTRLDELKRQELERLKHLTLKENQLNNDVDYNHLKMAEHLDHTNPRTFEINDLKKLIIKTAQVLADVDKRRREEFKQYEMQKRFEEQQKLKGNTGMTEEEKKNYEEQLRAAKEKHKQHEPLHHPGSKQQLEEVWEKQDHMESEDFDPRTFFHLHDVDGNGLWDQYEVKALFLKELDKLYAEGASENDLFKRAEEMERMREHVLNEADTNRDGFIDYNEFLKQTKKPDFQQDQGWEGLDEQQIYSQQEYEWYEKMKQMELQNAISKGMQPPAPDSVPVNNQQFPAMHGNVPYQHHDADHPQQVPGQQQYHGQPQQQYHPQINNHQEYHGQVPPQPQVHNQIPQQQVHGQIPQQQQQQQQLNPGQNSQQQYQGQVPQQQQFQGQVPQQGQQQAQFQQPHLQQQQFQQAQQQANLQQQNSQNQAAPQANNPVNTQAQQNVQNQANPQAVPAQPNIQQINPSSAVQH